MAEDSSSVNTNAVNTDSVINNTGNNQGSSVNQDPCPKCPDKDIRRLAIMMAKHSGGNAQDYYDAMVNDNFVAERSAENVADVANIALAGEAGGIISFFRSLFTKKIVIITFGKNANQIFHTFRHIEANGLSKEVVKKAVQKSVKQYASLMKTGKPFNKTIEVGGKKIRYSAYKLPSGEINVGRIVIPK